MIKVEEKCPNCNSDIISYFGQSLRPNGKLTWYQSYHCEKCSDSVEIDDLGIPPNEVRQKILSVEGEWNLIVESVDKKKKMRTSQLLRNLFNYSMLEMKDLLKNIPGIVFHGTKTEVEWIQVKLEEINVTSKIEPIQ